MTLEPAETLQAPLYAPEPRRLKLAVAALVGLALAFAIRSF